MKAMILSAGAGTRLRPLTGMIPKPMLPVIEKPVIEFIIELLAKNGVDEMMINISHHGSLIQDYLKSGYGYGLSIGYSFEGHFENGQLKPEPYGSAGGMKKIQTDTGFFDETFIVACGDAIIDLDIKEALEFHRASRALTTIVAKEVSIEQVSNYGIIVSERNGRVRSFQEKPTQAEAMSTIANTGIYIFEPSVFDYIPQGQFYDIGSQLLPELVKKGESVYSFVSQIEWYDVGRSSDYISILGQALKGKVKGYKPSGKEKAPGLWLGTGAIMDISVEIAAPVHIGGMTRIGKNVKLEGPVAIGSNCEIGEDCHLSNVYVSNYTRIEAGLMESNILFTPEYFVRSDGSSGQIMGSQYSKYVSDTRSKK